MDLIFLVDTEIPIKIIRNEGKMEWNRHILIKLIKKKRKPSNLFLEHSKEVIR